MKTYYSSIILLFFFCSICLLSCNKQSGAIAYISPEKAEYSPDGEILAVSDRTAAKLYFFSNFEKEAELPLDAIPSDILWISNKELIITLEDKSRILLYNFEKEEVEKKIDVCKHPSSLSYVTSSGELWISSSGLNRLFVYDLESGKETCQLVTGRYPVETSLSPDGSQIAVSCLLPENSQDDRVSSEVWLFNTTDRSEEARIALPYGSSNLRNAVYSPDGKYLYAVHTRGRVNLPTSQLEKGWVNTNMLSVIDLETNELFLPLLLDRLSEGAANPWDIEISRDGSTAFITAAGTHELVMIDLKKLYDILEGKEFPEGLMENYSGAETARDIWEQISDDEDNRYLLADKLSALYAAGVLERIKLPLKVPKSLSISHKNMEVAIPGYYSGNLISYNLQEGKITRDISLGQQPPADDVRSGELLFNDATQCFQSWLSCVTCHPDGRADGLNWDLLNDGIGNPKNTKSLLLSHETPPVMSRGVRPDYSTAVSKGFHFIQFYESDEDENAKIMAYLENMEPAESPYITDSNQEKISIGSEIFHSSETGCAECHPGPLYTNLKMYDVGSMEYPDRFPDYDTPTLIEVWRTGPYMHNGAAETIMEVLSSHNKEDMHGVTSSLNEEELEALSLFVLSL